MAGLINLFIGKTEGVKRAEQALLEAEDRLMAFDPREAEDLGVHASKESNRTQVIVARQRDSHAAIMQKTDRNWLTTIGIGGALMAKGIVSFHDLATWGATLLGLH